MSPDQRARALRLADEMERGQTLGYSWGVLDAVALLRELAAEPSPWPEGLRDRIESAIERINNRHAPRRIPADPTDVDLVLAEVRALMDGKDPPFWLKRAIPQDQQDRVPLTDELAVSPQEVTEALRFVRTHLYAAQAQASPGDDSIIMRHVYDAYRRIADLTKEVELHGITGDAK